MRTVEEKNTIVANNQFNSLGWLNEFVNQEGSESRKKYFDCIEKHEKEIFVIHVDDNHSRYYCPVCLICFDVDCS